LFFLFSQFAQISLEVLIKVCCLGRKILPKKKSKMDRRMDEQEQIFYRESSVGKRVTGMFWIVKDAEAYDSSKSLADAVEKLFQRHPVFRSKVVDEADGLHWKPCCNDVKHHVQTSELALEGEETYENLKNALRQRLEDTIGEPLSNHLLAKLTRVGKSGFVLTFSHCLMDGFSRLLFARDLGKAFRGEALSEAEEVDMPALWKLYKQDVVASEEAAGWQLPYDDTMENPANRLAIETIEEDGPGLVAACRAQKCKLTAALLTAVVRVSGGEGKVGVGCPVNVRPRVKLPPNELFNCGVPGGVTIDCEKPFWDAARATQEQLLQETESLGLAQIVLSGFRGMLKENRGKPWPEDVSIFIPFICSNLGRCDLPQVDCLFGSLGRNHGAAVFLSMHSLGPRCCLSASFLTPLFDRKRIAKILSDAMALIKE
jgi:hypothetical protein